LHGQVEDKIAGDIEEPQFDYFTDNLHGPAHISVGDGEFLSCIFVNIAQATLGEKTFEAGADNVLAEIETHNQKNC